MHFMSVCLLIYEYYVKRGIWMGPCMHVCVTFWPDWTPWFHLKTENRCVVYVRATASAHVHSTIANANISSSSFPVDGIVCHVNLLCAIMCWMILHLFFNWELLNRGWNARSRFCLQYTQFYSCRALNAHFSLLSNQDFVACLVFCGIQAHGKTNVHKCGCTLLAQNHTNLHFYFKAVAQNEHFEHRNLIKRLVGVHCAFSFAFTFG